MNSPDLPPSAAFDHGFSRLLPFPTEYSTRFVALSNGALRSLVVLTTFYYVCHVMLRLSRRVKFKHIKYIMGTSSFILDQSLFYLFIHYLKRTAHLAIIASLPYDPPKHVYILCTKHFIK